jgi:hypothetical protein
MTLFHCPRCGYDTIVKSNIKSHINRKKICKPVLKDINIKDFEVFIITNTYCKLEEIKNYSNLKEEIKVLKTENNNMKKIKEIKNHDTFNEKIKLLEAEIIEIKALNGGMDEYSNLKEKIKVLETENKCLKERIYKLDKNIGHIYIIYNRLFEKDVYKVGCSKNPQDRLKAYTTPYPTPCDIKYISEKFNNKLKAEKYLFNLLVNHRVESNREFFKINLEKLIEFIKITEQNVM